MRLDMPKKIEKIRHTKKAVYIYCLTFVMFCIIFVIERRLIWLLLCCRSAWTRN